MDNAHLPSEIDLAWYDPELADALRALLSGDPAAAYTLLAATRDQPDRRELCVEVLGAAGAGQLPTLRAGVEQQRDDADRLLLWGSALSSAAWQARGAARAEHTSAEQFGQLIDLTKQARMTLRRVAKLAPDDAAPWSVLVACALGAPDSDDEGDEVWRQAQARATDLFWANQARLQTLAAKWYGSNEKMLEFARSRAGALPDGHPLLALVPAAQVEMLLDTLASGNLIKRMWKGSRYLGRAAVREEVNAASDRLFAGADTYRTHPRWMMAHQWFAYCYYQMTDDMGSKPEDSVRLARHLEQAGDQPSLWPWGYFGDFETHYAKARRTAANIW